MQKWQQPESLSRREHRQTTAQWQELQKQMIAHSNERYIFMWLVCLIEVLIHRLDTRQNLQTEHHAIKKEYVPVACMLPTTLCALYEQLQYTVNEEKKKNPGILERNISLDCSRLKHFWTGCWFLWHEETIIKLEWFRIYVWQVADYWLAAA